MEYCSFPLAPLATCRPALLQANYDHVAQSAVHDDAGGVAQRFLPWLLVGELVGLDGGRRPTSVMRYACTRRPCHTPAVSTRDPSR
jgi:hypothetical protein